MNPKQLDFYKVIIDTKTELDALLPNVGVDKYLLPQVRKDLLERLKDAKGFKNGVKLLASGFKDA